MDRSLNFSSVSTFSTKSPRTPVTNPRRSLTAGISAHRSSRYSVSGRSTQSAQVIYKTPFHVVESYGVALPVMVTEALAFADRSSTISIRLGASGWAWFVCGRRLLVWQYRQEGQGRWAPGSQCRELTLPPSDLAHRAQLVAVYVPDRAHIPSCIAVSPEGAVRYWSSIAQEGSWIEENADLRGQECDSLSDMTSVGCILATTTATICLVVPRTSGGRHSVSCHTLRAPQSWLGGIGRRMSSIIFGSMPAAHTLENNLVKVVPLSSSRSIECKLIVLSGRTMQKWLLSTKEPEQIVFEFDMDRQIREGFLQSIWDSSTNTAQELSIWILDMQAVEGGVVLLLAAANTHASNTIYYAVALVMTESDKAPESFHMFTTLKLSGYYQGEETESEDLTYQLLFQNNAFYIYTRKHLVAIASSANSSQEEPDRIDFISSGDCILGGFLSTNTPLFFTRSHGLVSVCPRDSNPLDVLNTSVSFSEAPSDRLSMSQFSETANLSLTGATLEDLAEEKSAVSRLKAAFVLFNRREVGACEDILAEIFPPEYESRMDIDAPMDQVILQVSQDIVNDMPAADPRWAETHLLGPGISSSSSLQILQQLQGKQQTLELYVHFLRSVKVWGRLSAISVRGVTLATVQAIQEHAEKLVAAIALRNMQTRYGDLLDKVIRAVIHARKTKVTGSLTHLDLFFREVTKFPDFPHKLGDWSHNMVHSNKPPGEVVELLQQANLILLEILREIAAFRKRADLFASVKPLDCDSVEYLPWTAAPGKEGLHDAIHAQLERNVQFGARQICGDPVARAALCESLLGLADVLLDGYRAHLESLRGGEKHELLVHQYEMQRRKIIQPFLDEDMTDAATKLAEKYLDFQTLAQLCETTNNQERLDQYIHKFAEHGFSEFLLGWYMKDGKQDRLLRLLGGNGRPMQHQQALMGFLSQHPHLAWLQALRANQFSAAATTLRKLAAVETERLARKKSMLSLAKLSALASDEPSQSVEVTVFHIDRELQLVGLQEELPQSVLTFLNQDPDSMAVFPPGQLIDFYIGGENEKANEHDFKKALDLLNYIDDETNKEELRRHIWCQAILRDSWESLDLTDPCETCKQMLFCRLVDNLITSEEMESIISLEALKSSSELGELVHNQGFNYLLHFFYEQLSSLEG